MRMDATMQEQMAGSTAITCLIKNNRLYCANAGDSRMIACVNGKVEVLSDDHKPNNEKEHKRICDAGGFVECNRVNGNLALSRALGDFMFKRNLNKIPEEQIVTAYPDVSEREITEDWEFAVLACDGIWDVLRNEVINVHGHNIRSVYQLILNYSTDRYSILSASDSQWNGSGANM